jgi:uncharacterized membrane protein
MRTVLLVLHVVLAIFLIGPLVFAANQAAGALRRGDTAVLTLLARLVTVYGYASVLVALVGFGLVREKWGNQFSDGWLITSIVLWLAATALVVRLLGPMLRRAAAAGSGGTAGLAPRAAAIGGVASLAYVAVAVLMVWQPH